MIEYVNRIRLEHAKDFESSIFCDVYRNARFMVNQIIKQNPKHYEKSEFDDFCNENYVANVISFLGERGMGKSSTMLSFAYHLGQYNSNEIINGDLHSKYNYGSTKFYIMPKIDAAILAKGEGLFDVVLANLWDKFKSYDKEYYDKSYEYEQIKTRFKNIKNTYSQYLKQYGKEKNEVESYTELHDLNHVLNLRMDFLELVETYLTYIDRDSCRTCENVFLVFSIDDIDLANDGSYSVLEQLRMFFSIPHVIILTTADKDRLALNLKTELSNKLLYKGEHSKEDLNVVSHYRFEYLSKVLPRNMRIYMPHPNEINDPEYNEIEEHISEIYGDKYKVKGMNAEKFIKLLIAKKLQIMVGEDIKCFSLVSNSLRNNVNTLSEVIELLVDQKNDHERSSMFYQWYKKALTLGMDDIEDSDIGNNIKKLWTIPDWLINYYISHIDNINLQQDYDKQNASKLDVSYSQVLNSILELQNNYPMMREEIQRLILIYSMRIRNTIGIDVTECNKNKSLIKYTGENIFSDLNTGVETVLKTKVSAEMFADFSLTTSDTKGKKLKLNSLLDMGNNANKVIESFIVFLFCDFKTGELPIKKYLQNEVKTVQSKDNINSSVELISGKSNQSKESELEEFANKINYASVEIFYNNLISCDELWKNYFEWFIKCINIECTDKEKEAADRKLKGKLAEYIKIDELSEWVAKYNIKTMYDFIPIQNVDIMLDVARALVQPKCLVKFLPDSIVNNAGVILKSLTDMYNNLEEEYNTKYMDNAMIPYYLKLSELNNMVSLRKIEFENQIIPAKVSNENHRV